MKYLAVILLLACSAVAQVQVSQSFVDDANAAFKEVVASREAISAQKAAITALEKYVLLLEKQSLIQQAQITDLAKLKCDTTSIFWVIKNKRCH